MNRSERFYQIDQLLSARKVMSRQELLDALEVSWATLKRDLAYLRERFNAPIIFDKDAGGYRFGEASLGPKYELPGLWFSGQETYALMTMHHLLEELEPGLLAPTCNRCFPDWKAFLAASVKTSPMFLTVFA